MSESYTASAYHLSDMDDVIYDVISSPAWTNTVFITVWAILRFLFRGTVSIRSCVMVNNTHVAPYGGREGMASKHDIFKSSGAGLIWNVETFSYMLEYVFTMARAGQ